jgi:fucose 4-O-acetylase-like acetyltransferase
VIYLHGVARSPRALKKESRATVSSRHLDLSPAEGGQRGNPAPGEDQAIPIAVGRVRDKQIDALKGLAILLVVLGHVLIYAYGMQSGMVDRTSSSDVWVRVCVDLIYSFHMPLFMALSGYIAYQGVPARHLRWVGRKGMQLLFPFFAWYSLPYLLGRKGPYGGVVGYMSGLPRYLSGAVITPGNGLWFLYVLFWCFVALAFFHYVDGRRAGWWTLALLAVILVTTSLTGFDAFGIALLGLPGIWFAVGYLFAQYRWCVPDSPSRGFVLAGVAFPLLFAVTRLQSQVPLLSTGLIMKLLLSATGIAACVVVMSYLSRTSLSRGSQWLGKRTMGVYVMHMFLLGVWAVTLRLPMLLGPVGIAVDLLVVLTASLVAASVLGMNRLTASVFLGTPPKRRVRDHAAIDGPDQGA